jgi:hypothetical protein
MPAVKPEAPEVLKEIICRWGYKVLFDDEFTWILESKTDPQARPIVIPKDAGEDGTVGIEIMQQTLIDTKLDLFHYFALLKQIKGDEPEHVA